ncbi:hypothetical protein QFZ27_004663 [Inquilinus ginsengisoli]|uniref:primase-helicase family protein n=1 Tax=Inquilinus ginsengisoli TaxID=363840 RepID=UPI003D2389FF
MSKKNDATSAASVQSKLKTRYIFIIRSAAFWDQSMRTFVEPRALDLAFARTKLKVPGSDDLVSATMYARHCGWDADDISFMPGEDEFFDERGVRYFNLWRPTTVRAVEDDVTPFVEHARYILDGDEVAIRYVLDFMAHVVQHPSKKVRSAVLITSQKHGVGKSTIAEMFAKVVGVDHAKAIETRQLLSPFNGWLKDALFVWVNELKVPRQSEITGVLKELITTDEMQINEKHQPVRKIRQFANFMLFSNHEDAMPVEQSDRRIFVHHSKAAPRDRAYYDGLWHWFDHGGAEALLYFLRHRDIREFDRNAPAPMSDDKALSQQASRPPWQQHLDAALAAGADPFARDIVSVPDIADHLKGATGLTVSLHKVGQWLRDIGAADLGVIRVKSTGSNQTPKLWAARQPEFWRAVPPGDVAQHFVRGARPAPAPVTGPSRRVCTLLLPS